MKKFNFFVPGLPRAKQYRQTTGGVIYSKGDVATWERAIAQAATVAAGAGYKKLFGAIRIGLIFKFPIPRSRKDVKPGQPHLQDPDLTNLLKAAEDGLKRVLFHDDNMVWAQFNEKWWCEPGYEGVGVTVEIDELTY